MKVLLDECVPERLRKHLKSHKVHSARYAGFSGKKNGELLRLAEEAGYGALLTIDQGIPYQQSMTGRGIAVIVLRAGSCAAHKNECREESRHCTLRACATSLPEQGETC